MAESYKEMEKRQEAAAKAADVAFANYLQTKATGTKEEQNSAFQAYKATLDNKEGKCK